MATVSRRKGALGFAKQASRGSAAANPTFTVPKVSGGLKPRTERGDLPLTGDTVQRWGPFKHRAGGGGTVTILAHPEAAGLVIYEVTGAQAVGAGSNGAVLHTFTLADTIPFDNPLTIWDLVGDEWWKFVDAYISKITIRAASGDLVFIEMDVASFTAVPAAAPTYTLTEPEPRFKYIGGTFKAEADNATPALMTNIQSVELVIDRALTMHYGASLTPQEVECDRIVDFAAGIRYDSAQQGWDFLKGAHLGAVAGTSQEQTLLRGSFDASFGRHPVSTGRLLRVVSNGANWDYDTERPDSDPAGGAITYDAAGPVGRPTGGGTEITITLANETAGTY
jgi:hypothetical protein